MRSLFLGWGWNQAGGLSIFAAFFSTPAAPFPHLVQ